MKVLFVFSGNDYLRISSIIALQAKSLIDQNISVDYFPIQGKGIIGYLKNLLPLRKVLKKENYNIIHAHYGDCGLISLFARRKEKLVVSFMGGDILGDVDENGKKIIFRLLISRVYACLCCFYDLSIVKSKNIYNRLIFKKNAVIIPNGVDLSVFVPMDMNQSRDRLNFKKNYIYIIFSSGKERKEKNYNLALQAINIIDGYKIKLIEMKGFTSQELNLRYNACDLLLLTSFFEGSPNVIKEAIACNLPIVSTDVGDVKEVTNGIDGCFICGFNAKSVAMNVEKAIEFKRRTNGRKKIKSLSTDKIALKIINNYKRILINH